MGKKSVMGVKLRQKMVLQGGTLKLTTKVAGIFVQFIIFQYTFKACKATNPIHTMKNKENMDYTKKGG